MIASLERQSGAIAQAVDRLRLAGVQVPYGLVLGDDPLTAISGGSEGWPPGAAISNWAWARSVDRLSQPYRRNGQFYPQDSLTFRLLTTEAAVALAAGADGAS